MLSARPRRRRETLFRIHRRFHFCGDAATVPPAARPRKLHIPHPAASGRSRPLRCSSSPNSKRYAGLLFGSIFVLPEKSMQKRGAGDAKIALTREKACRSVVRFFVPLSVVRTPFGRRPHKLHIPRFRAGREISSIPLLVLSKTQTLRWFVFWFFSAFLFAPVEYLTYGSRKSRRVFRLPRRSIPIRICIAFCQSEIFFCTNHPPGKSKKGVSTPFLVVLRGFQRGKSKSPFGILSFDRQRRFLSHARKKAGLKHSPRISCADKVSPFG